MLRSWTLLASCLAPLALGQDDGGDFPSSKADAGRRHRLLSSSGGRGPVSPEQLELAPPEQLHLALADPRRSDLYAMSVCWYTLVDADSMVFWGLENPPAEVTVGNSTRECTYSVALHVVIL